MKDFVAESSKRIAAYEAELKKWGTMLSFDQMTMEDFAEAFPEKVLQLLLEISLATVIFSVYFVSGLECSKPNLLAP